MIDIFHADCKHCGDRIYLSGGSVLWRLQAAAEGAGGGNCPVGGDHKPVRGSIS